MFKKFNLLYTLQLSLNCLAYTGLS